MLREFFFGAVRGKKDFFGDFRCGDFSFRDSAGWGRYKYPWVGQKNIKQFDSNSDIVHERVKNTMFVLKCPDAHNKGN